MLKGVFLYLVLIGIRKNFLGILQDFSFFEIGLAAIILLLLMRNFGQSGK